MGPRVETHPAFPDRVNVGFAALDPETGGLRLRVWERGVGETRACGAGASAAVAVRRGWAVPPVTATFAGRSLASGFAGGTGLADRPLPQRFPRNLDNGLT